MAWLLHTDDNEKITCVTATRNRFELLKDSIECYMKQTYVNKELLIASQSDEHVNTQIEKHIAMLGRKDMRLFPVDPALSLGELRKKAAWEAWGEVVCQWDDDDLYHPKRLATQFNEMQRTKSLACFYDSHLKYFKNEGTVYWIDWSLEKGEPWHRVLTGSAMYFKKHKDRYLDIVNFYPDKLCYEDVDFAEKVFQTYPVAISKSGYQYVYVYHGSNVYNESHHYGILKSKHVYSKSDVYRNHLNITDSLSGVSNAKIMGSDGVAFEI